VAWTKQVQVKFYSKPEREKLHPAGKDLRFGGAFLMRPEAAARLAFGLVELDRASGMYRRCQLTPVDERMIIEHQRARESAEAAPEERSSPEGNKLRR
jgi:hypothetical protein